MTDQQLGAFLGATIGALVLVLIICLAISIFMIVVYWKLFSKAGEAGWKAIIPIYNSYILFKIAKAPLFFFVWLACMLLSFSTNETILVIRLIGTLVAYIILDVKIAKAFGKSAGFAVGLIIFPIIFFPILAFGSATYQGDAQEA